MPEVLVELGDDVLRDLLGAGERAGAEQKKQQELERKQAAEQQQLAEAEAKRKLAAEKKAKVEAEANQIIDVLGENGIRARKNEVGEGERKSFEILVKGDDTEVAAAIQLIRPNVLLLNEIDGYVPGGTESPPKLFLERYLRH